MALEIIKQIAGGLDYAHGAQVNAVNICGFQGENFHIIENFLKKNTFK